MLLSNHRHIRPLSSVAVRDAHVGFGGNKGNRNNRNPFMEYIVVICTLFVIANGMCPKEKK